MMRNKLLFLWLPMLVSLAFCLETALRTDPSESSTVTARIGRLVVQKGVRLLPGEAEENKVQDGLADHSEGYQSDSQESEGSNRAAESKLQRLNPSVHCGNDSMALRVQGNRMPNFMVDKGEEGAVPVAKMPAHCGISMKRVRRDVLLIAQYEGCHVTQQGDDYILPLRLWGTSMTICCPVASSTNVTNGQPDAPSSDPQPHGPAFDPFLYQHGHPFYPDWHFWHSPTSTPTVAPTPAPSTAASTAPAVPASDPQQDWYPFGPFPYHHKRPFYPYGHFWHRPTSAPSTAAPTPAPTTTTSTAPTVPASDPQQDWYPLDPFPYHHKRPFYPYGHFWHRPTSAPSTAAPTPAPTTTTSTAPAVPASDPQQDWYPLDPFPYHHMRPFYPYGHFWHRPTSAPSTAASTPAPTTTTSTAPTVPASDPQHHGYPYAPLAYSHRRHPFYPYVLPWMQPADASMSTSNGAKRPFSSSDNQQPLFFSGAL